VTTLAGDDERLGWRGVSSVVRDGGWSQPWRIDDDAWLRRVPLLRERAAMPGGARWELEVSGVAELRFEVLVDGVGPGEECSAIDVVRPGRPLLRIPLRPGVNPVSVPARGDQQVTIWWPQYGIVRISTVRVFGVERGGLPVVAAAASRSPRWVAYGSSITQCRTALGPTETWPALVATELDWDLTCLGFGGQAHLDPVVARAIRDRPAEIISLCVGVNIQGAASLSARTLGPLLGEFVRTIREWHPATPIVVISPICCPERESAPNAVGMTLSDARGIVHDVVTELRNEGDAAITAVDGLTALGLADAPLLADGLHPTPEGYHLMARRLAPVLLREQRTLTAATHSPTERIIG
jgi:hypothetical protein